MVVVSFKEHGGGVYSDVVPVDIPAFACRSSDGVCLEMAFAAGILKSFGNWLNL
jgi:hypothetical protein